MPPSRHFRRSVCANGARRWASRPLSAPAAGCFRRRSRPRRCCAPGCGGSMRMGVQFALRHRWTGWDERRPSAVPDAGRTARRRCRARPCWRSAAQAGRGSAPMAAGWKRSRRRASTIAPLRPANCGFTVAWSDIFRDRFEGQPLKGVALSFGAHTRARRGHGHAHGHRGRRDLCAVGRIARGHRRIGRRRPCTSPCGPIWTPSDLIARLSAPQRQAIAFELAAQGRAACRRSRSACCRRRRSHPARRCRRCRPQRSPS